jgi:type I restriction enzyme, S subunit
VNEGELPEGWRTVRLGDVCSKIGSGATPRGGSAGYVAKGTPFVRSMNVHFDGFSPEGLVFLNSAQAEALRHVAIQEGDVLLNITGASIGRVMTVPASLAGARVNQHVSIIRLRDGVEPNYVAAYLRSPSVQRKINSEEYGVTRQALTKAWITEFELPLPPVAEQKQIMAKLEERLESVNAARDLLGHIPGLLKRFRQAVLAAAYNGGLTEGWRKEHAGFELPVADSSLGGGAGDPDLPAGWRPSTIGELGQVSTGTTPPKTEPAYYGGNVPFFKPTDLDAGYSVSEAREWLTAVGATKARLLSAYAVLVTCIGATIGKTGLSRVAGATNQQINAVEPEPSVCSPSWLYWAVCSPALQSSIRDEASETTLPILNKSRFEALSINVPPRREQDEIVLRVEALFGLTDALVKRVAEASARSDRVTQAILDKAFRGDLG